MNFWPGTNIRKSRGNAFDWRDGISVIANDKEIKMSNNSKMQMAGAGSDPKKAFTIYSKARALK